MNTNAATAPAPWLAKLPLSPHHHHTAHIIVNAGQAVVPPEGLADVLRFEPNGQGGWISAAQASDGRWGFIDGTGAWQVAPTLQNTRCFSDDGLARFCQGGLWGFVNLAGAVAIAPAFADARPFRHGLSAVQLDSAEPGGWRIIDRTGQFTSDAVLHGLSLFGANGLARATHCDPSGRQRLQGFVDGTGQWVIEPRFRKVLPFGESPVTAASLDGERFGLIDAHGQWVLEPRYPRIEAFNDHGLAYFDEVHAWENGHGYLDVRGQVVVKGGRHLSPYMACGVATNCYAGTHYLNAQGQPLPGPRLSFGSHFYPQGGFAVVRTAAATAGTGAGTDAPPGAWGLLHADGRWVPAPEQLLEPLTNGEGWLAGLQADTPLLPFLTRDGQLAYIDGEGAVVWRAHYDGQQVALLDASGEPLWRSAAREDCWPPRPFFHTSASDHLQGGLEAMDGIVSLAGQLLAEAEARLHHLAAGEPLERDEGGNPDGDATDDEGREDEAADPEQVQADRTVVARRVLRACLSKPHNGPYEFLCSELNQVTNTARVALVQRLSEHYGAPDANPEHAAPWHQQRDYPQAWPVALARPLPGDTGTVHATREQWLTLYKHSDAGDGDVWWELWLMVAPSKDALALALRSRQGASTPGLRQGAGVASAPQPIPRTPPDGGPAVRQAGESLPRSPAAGRTVAWSDSEDSQWLPDVASASRSFGSISRVGTGSGPMQQERQFSALDLRTALDNKSRALPALWGPVGWPALRWLLGLGALVAHAFVSIGAWRAEGPWVGLGTFVLAGFADVYWAWRFAFSAPYAPGLAAAAVLVVAYVLGWRWMFGRIGRAHGARLGRAG